MTSAPENGSVGFEHHDHRGCIAEAVSVAEAVCADRKVRFTPGRRRVLEILLEEHRALGAYDILDRLNREGRGSQPPVAYRALDFLVKHGFVHKIGAALLQNSDFGRFTSWIHAVRRAA